MIKQMDSFGITTTPVPDMSDHLKSKAGQFAALGINSWTFPWQGG